MTDTRAGRCESSGTAQQREAQSRALAVAGGTGLFNFQEEDHDPERIPTPFRIAQLPEPRRCRIARVCTSQTWTTLGKRHVRFNEHDFSDPDSAPGVAWEQHAPTDSEMFYQALI